MKDFGPARLAFIGKRQYVHSTTIFSRFLDLAGSHAILVESFKFARETSRDGRFILLEAGEQRPAAQGLPAASISFRTATTARLHFEFIDDGDAVQVREPDPSYALANEEYDADFVGRAAIAAVDGNQFFRSLVEINKRAHAETLKRRGEAVPEFRFAYVEQFDPLAWQQAREITLKHLGIRTGGGRNFSLNQAEFGMGPKPCRICFSW